MGLSSGIIQINIKTPDEMCRLVAERVKERRLALDLTQQGLSDRADINIESYRKFERTGEIAFKSLVKIAMALELLDEINALFVQKNYQHLDDLINDKEILRKRGKRG